VSKFNFSVCRLVKTVSRAGPQNIMFGNRSAMKHLLTGQYKMGTMRVRVNREIPKFIQ
jgi:hypothetical protein